jgi:hypothetical protein
MTSTGSRPSATRWFQGDSVLILEDGSKVVTGTTYREKIRLLSH